MKPFYSVLCLLPLALLSGCSPDVGDKIMKCEIEGQRGGVQNADSGLYVMSCMRRSGFQFVPTEGKCSGFQGAHDSACYTKSSSAP